jgi:hypothetical protein
MLSWMKTSEGMLVKVIDLSVNETGQGLLDLFVQVSSFSISYMVRDLSRTSSLSLIDLSGNSFCCSQMQLSMAFVLVRHFNVVHLHHPNTRRPLSHP